MGALIRLDPRRAPRDHAVDRAMDLQVAAHEMRREGVALWAAARATNDWALLSEAKALADTLRAVETQARRMAAISDGLANCPMGLWSRRDGSHAA